MIRRNLQQFLSMSGLKNIKNYMYLYEAINVLFTYAFMQYYGGLQMSN